MNFKLTHSWRYGADAKMVSLADLLRTAVDGLSAEAFALMSELESHPPHHCPEQEIGPMCSSQVNFTARFGHVGHANEVPCRILDWLRPVLLCRNVLGTVFAGLVVSLTEAQTGSKLTLRAPLEC